MTAPMDLLGELKEIDAAMDALTEERDGLLELIRSLEERVKMLELADRGMSP